MKSLKKTLFCAALSLCSVSSFADTFANDVTSSTNGGRFNLYPKIYSDSIDNEIYRGSELRFFFTISRSPAIENSTARIMLDDDSKDSAQVLESSKDSFYIKRLGGMGHLNNFGLKINNDAPCKKVMKVNVVIDGHTESTEFTIGSSYSHIQRLQFHYPINGTLEFDIKEPTEHEFDSSRMQIMSEANQLFTVTDPSGKKTTVKLEEHYIDYTYSAYYEIKESDVREGRWKIQSEGSNSFRVYYTHSRKQWF